MSHNELHMKVQTKDRPPQIYFYVTLVLFHIFQSCLISLYYDLMHANETCLKKLP